jgi:hypothetical protein
MKPPATLTFQFHNPLMYQRVFFLLLMILKGDVVVLSSANEYWVRNISPEVSDTLAHSLLRQEHAVEATH